MPKMCSGSRLSRREWLKCSSGTLLAAGLWPGRLIARDNGKGGSFRFAVVNDTHFQGPKCSAWFEQVKATLASHDPKPEFCLMVGDLAEHGTASELGSMRDALRSFGMPFWVVPGNHDWAAKNDTSTWKDLFPNSLNYHFEHQGWQFVGLDSTQGTDWQGTKIQPEIFKWTDENLPKLNPVKPTVLFTHFPLGENVISRPINADELLERFRPFNLVAAYNGHFHGFTERKLGKSSLTTNKCCSISRANHDGTPEKGYFLCAAKDGQIQREFIQVPVRQN